MDSMYDDYNDFHAELNEEAMAEMYDHEEDHDPSDILFAEYLYDLYNGHEDDSMDGDWDSGMTSAGWGTDEDYGYFGGEDY